MGSAILIATAALTNVYFVHSFDQRVPVVVVVRDMHVGQQISRADVSTARVTVDATVPTIPERQLAEVVGQRAAVRLRKGVLLSASQVTGQSVPGPGQAVVTVPLKTAQVPLGLAPGWQVRVVPTPGAVPGQGTNAPEPAAAPSTTAAVVDHVSEPSTEGTVTVSLVVAEGDSVGIARQAAPGAVALIVTAKGS